MDFGTVTNTTKPIFDILLNYWTDSHTKGNFKLLWADTLFVVSCKKTKVPIRG